MVSSAYSGIRLIQGYGLLRAGSVQDSGQASEFFLAFGQRKGHNFIGISGNYDFVFYLSVLVGKMFRRISLNIFVVF